VPLYFYLKSKRPFGFAGLYETWIAPDKKKINTCIIITTCANKLVLPFHDRMPVILPKEQERVWLESTTNDASDLLSILKPYPAEKINCEVKKVLGA
jgi:putative SOS response-associated peptidase YedK